DWALRLGENEGFKQFIDYVNENGPKLLTLLGNLIDIIINVGVALAPLAGKVLDARNAYSEWLAEMSETHKSIVIAFVLVSILGGLFMALITPITFVTTVLGPLLAKFLGFESVKLMFLAIIDAIAGISAPVLIVIGVIALLVG